MTCPHPKEHGDPPPQAESDLRKGWARTRQNDDVPPCPAQVTTLTQSLTVKEQSLRQKEREANDKLQQMVLDQQEAERQQTVARRIAEELAGPPCAGRVGL